MKKQVKDKVRRFMFAVDTRKLNTNQFVIEYYRYINGTCTISNIFYGESIASIDRCRRKLIAEHPELMRDDISRDSPELYADTFRNEYNLNYKPV